MKKALLLAIATLFVLTMNARTIWSGSQELDWNNGKYLEINSTTVGTINTGDYLVISYTINVPDNQWPQFWVNDSGWNQQAGYNLTNGMTQHKVYVTASMAQALSSGIIMTGYGITLSKIEIEEGNGNDGNHSVWQGEETVGNWTGFSINASAFANAKVGQKLRIRFKNLGAGAILSPRDPNGWTQLPDGDNVTISGSKYDYTITNAMLNVLKARGLIVGGVNFTCTSVELWNADEVKPLTLQVPVTNNWVFEGSNVPTFNVSITNPYSTAVDAKIVLEVATDKMVFVKSTSKTVTVQGNNSQRTETVKAEDLAPGIYHATITVNDDLARGFFFAVKPTEIVSAPDKQSDFDSYWAAAKQQLAAIPVNATLTELPAKSSSKRKVYLVEMQSVPDGLSGDPVIVRGYYAEPTDGKKHPVLIHYQGYDSQYRPGGDSSTPWCINANWDSEESSNFAEFVLSNRGQSINNRPASGRDDGVLRDFTNTYGDWFAYKFGNKDSYYYRGAYMDCVRAIDFLASRDACDMNNLFAEGQSQGGAFTVAAAALSDYKFNAIAPAITFMGDFPDYFELVNWPGGVAFSSKGSMTDEEMYAFMSYYDTKNLATSITSPYITSIGLQDNVCPPHTNIAPYNNAQTPAEDKQAVYNAELQHQTNYWWGNTYMEFFKKYMKDTTGITSVSSEQTKENNKCYDLQGRVVDHPTRGLYVMNGRKMMVR